MLCDAVQHNQQKTVRGNSGSRPFCIATLTGLFIGASNMKKIDISTKKNQGLFAIVDDEDFGWLSKYRWFACKLTSGTYVARAAKNPYRNIFMHRQILNTPKGSLTDHINHNRLDNRRCNLRICDASQNQWNVRPHSGGTSKYKGVSWNAGYKKWVAVIRANGKNMWLGSFTEETDAARAYDKKAIECHGEFASINFKQ